MEPLYIFKLPAPVDGQTHVGVTEEIRDGGLFKVTGTYGKLPVAGWRPATAMGPFQRPISGDERVDLIEQANVAGRPSTLPDHDVRSSDLVAFLEEDPAVREARIGARETEEPAA